MTVSVRLRCIATPPRQPCNAVLTYLNLRPFQSFLYIVASGHAMKESEKSMSPEDTLLTADEREALGFTILASHVPDEQYADAAQQQEASALGMWIFLGTEVLFFGSLFLGLFTYRHMYPLEFEAASRRLSIVIG